MELSGKYKIELVNFQKAIQAFDSALNATFRDLGEIGEDLIKNGKIQKFEYCAELSWKISKMFLELNTALLANSPKTVYKGLFQNDLINENLYGSLFNTIEHRIC